MSDISPFADFDLLGTTKQNRMVPKSLDQLESVGDDTAPPAHTVSPKLDLGNIHLDLYPMPKNFKLKDTEIPYEFLPELPSTYPVPDREQGFRKTRVGGQ